MDRDLIFLKEANNDDLVILVDYLTKDKNGGYRISEELSGTELYKKNYPHNLRVMTDAIERELRLFGGNTIANIFRGEGPSYKEILCNVAKKCKVNFSESSSTERIEMLLLQKVFDDALEKMSEEDLKNVMNNLDIKKTVYGKAAMVMAIQYAVRSSGFLAYKMSVIVANMVARTLFGRGLSLAVNAGLTRSISVFAGPIGWAITGVWLIFDIASPAFRVTLPAVIHIAYMRQRAMTKFN